MTTFLSSKPYTLIAELGSNHNGDKARALNLIAHAAAAGATHAKFQLWHPDLFYSKQAMPEQHAAVTRLALPDDWIPELAAKAKECGVGFLCTPFDEQAVATVDPYVEFHKIASGDLLTIPLLRAVARTGKPVLLSTGAATVDEIRDAQTAFIFALDKQAADDIDLAHYTRQNLILLHCVSAYPTPAAQANIGAIAHMQREFQHFRIGYSDHTGNPYAILAAHALGAKVYEVHFDLPDRKGAETDHSITNDKLSFLRAALDSLEHPNCTLWPGAAMDYAWQGHFNAAVYLLAHGEKRVMECEASERDYARRGLYLARDVKAGEPLAGALVALRPAKGAVKVAEWDDVQNMKATMDMQAGEPLYPGSAG